ncbi:MAG TPA: iron-sulfur cluster assembly accessory protein [Nitrospiria bacterium]|jgi:iron-sulfur cluster assembly protein|nr:iron-sulfur cluster assembly accessory protein [Nitrospiria bacterium]
MPGVTERVLELTPSALKEVKRLIQTQNKGDVALRVGVKGGGCSGLTYTMSFEAEVGPHDQLFEVDSLRVVVDAKSAIYLQGMTLDFIDSLQESGFKFINPNAKQSCGCGTSFSA